MQDPEIHQREPADPGQTQRHTGPSNRILVVDDDVDQLRLSAEVLRRSGYQAETAEDGEAAWQELQAKRYDLLITDNNMPRVSGVELVKKVRSAHMPLTILLASGGMPEEELRRQPWLQPVATLLKPFSVDDLLATVKALLNGTECAPRRNDPLQSQAADPLTDEAWLHSIPSTVQIPIERQLPCRG